MVATLLYNWNLIREFVSRDIRDRYVGSIIGVFWSILNPILQLSLYTVVFSTILNIKFGDRGSTGQFAQYLFCALLPWMALQESVTRSSRSFIENNNLIQKVRFPLEVLPFSLVLSAFVHQLLGTLIFLVFLMVNRSLHSTFLALAIILFAFQILMVYGLSLLVACLNVFFRDVSQVLGLLFMLMFWITPIVYPKHLAGDVFLWVLNLNPLTHLVEAYRFVFLGSPIPSLWGVAYWAVFSAGVYCMGKFVLKRTQRELVDLL